MWHGGEVVLGGKWEILQDPITTGKSHLCRGGITFLSLIPKTILILQDLAIRFFSLLWTQVILSSSLEFLLAGEGIFLNGVSGNFDSGLSEIPGTESLKFRLLHGFPGHVFFFFAWKFYTSGIRGFYIFMQDFQHLVPGWSRSSACLSWTGTLRASQSHRCVGSVCVSTTAACVSPKACQELVLQSSSLQAAPQSSKKLLLDHSLSSAVLVEVRRDAALRGVVYPRERWASAMGCVTQQSNRELMTWESLGLSFSKSLCVRTVQELLCLQVNSQREIVSSSASEQ